MTYQLNCPACSKHLYFQSVGDNEDFLESICRNCQYKYALYQTELESFVSNVKTKSSTTFTENTSCNRVYNLRLQQANGTLKFLTFSTLKQSEKISSLAGDTILLLYTLRGKVLENLVWIENRTTGRSYLLLHPEAKARSLGVNTAFLTLVASGILAGLLHIPTNQLFWAAAIFSSIGVGGYISKRSSIKIRDRLEVERLSAEQQFLAQKHKLEQKSVELTQELEASHRLIQRLEALHQKMISLDEALYEDRAETVAKAITVLEKQLELTKDLINAYLRLAEGIEIEYQASQLTFQLPGDVSEKILIRLEELKAIESAKEELALLVNPQKLLAEYRPEQN